MEAQLVGKKAFAWVDFRRSRLTSKNRRLRWLKIQRYALHWKPFTNPIAATSIIL
jgi:hypothetical protein